MRCVICDKSERLILEEVWHTSTVVGTPASKAVAQQLYRCRFSSQTHKHTSLTGQSTNEATNK